MPADRAKYVPNSDCQCLGEVLRLFLLPHQGWSSGVQPLRLEQEERPGPVEASNVSEMASGVPPMQASWLEAWRERCPVLPCFERNSNPETGCWTGNVDTPAVHPRPKSFPASNILAVLALKGPAVTRWNAHDPSFKNLPSRAGIERQV